MLKRLYLSKARKAGIWASQMFLLFLDYDLKAIINPDNIWEFNFQGLNVKINWKVTEVSYISSIVLSLWELQWLSFKYFIHTHTLGLQAGSGFNSITELEASEQSHAGSGTEDFQDCEISWAGEGSGRNKKSNNGKRAFDSAVLNLNLNHVTRQQSNMHTIKEFCWTAQRLRGLCWNEP